MINGGLIIKIHFLEGNCKKTLYLPLRVLYNLFNTQLGIFL